jgi:hypothetical protein
MDGGVWKMVILNTIWQCVESLAKLKWDVFAFVVSKMKKRKEW